MRKFFLLSMLLASAAATPALADPDNDHHHDRQQQTHSDRQESHADRHDNRGNSQHPPQFTGQNHVNGGNFNPQQTPQALQQQRVLEQHQQQVQQHGQRNNWAGRYNGGPQPNASQTNGNHNYRNGYAGGQYQQGQQHHDNNWNREHNRWANGGWNRNWRNDHRYDWHNYRDHHRNVFHLGVYFDPFGYGYRSFGIGFQLAPAYFGQNYWIDPGMYQLPYPPPGTQWVRYWNDALLVDMYTGEVVDVIHNFFW